MLSTLPAFLLGGGCAWAVCLRLAPPRPEENVTSAPHPSASTSTQPALPTAGARRSSVPELMDAFRVASKNIPPSRLLDLARTAGNFSPAECHTALTEAAQLTDPARQSAIGLLSLQWARTEPGPAMEWLTQNTDGETRSLSVQGVLAEWVGRDLSGFATWSSTQPGNVSKELEWPATSSMLASDPALFGKWWESRRNVTGPDRSDIAWRISDMRDVRKVLDAASSKTQYTGDQDTAAGQRWNMNGAAGWNALFEAAAVRWHDLDAPSFEEWLKTRSPLEQKAAWAQINQDKEKAPSTASSPPTQESGSGAATATPATAADAASQAQPTTSPSGTAATAPPDAAVFSRSDLTTPPPAQAAPRFAQSWADWWQQDASAAEAYLNACAWPVDLKFQARAKAYATRLPQ